MNNSRWIQKLLLTILSLSIARIFLASGLLFSQVNLFVTYDTIRYYDFIQDQDFYMLGFHYKYPHGKIIMQKTNQSGDILWIKQYDYSDYSSGKDIIINQEGDIIILGYQSEREDSYNTDTLSNIFIIKTNADGDTIWTSKIDIKKFDHPEAIVETHDNGYMITGSVYNEKNGSDKDILLLKINSDGEMIWWKTFGSGYRDEGMDIIGDIDNGFLITGVYEYDLSSYSKVFLLKTNANGDSTWMKKYHYEDYLFAKSLNRTNDGGYIITVDREYRKDQAGLIKTDANGDTVWTKSYHFGNGEENFKTIIQTSDGGYLLGGYLNGATDVRPPWSQMAATKIDSTGNLEWQKDYKHVPWPTKIFKYISGLIETNDGYYVLSVNESANNSLFFKIDFNGCYLQYPVIEGNNFFCTGDSTRLFTNSAYSSLTWSTGSDAEEIYVDTAGKYSLTLVDTNNCRIWSDTMDIIEHIPPELSIVPDQATTICSGDSVILTAAISNYDPLLNYNCAWNNSQFNGNEVTAFSPGIYSLLVEDGFCSSSDSIEIIVHYPFREKICIVTVDRSTGRNLVVWERTPGKGTAYYNIYREDQPIGLVPYSDLSVYLDMTADPEKRPYIYQISAVDTCGNESELSPYHKPHFLQFVSADGGVNLQWDDYLIEGDSVNFINYTIYRGSDSVVLSPLEENVPRIIHNYTDTDPSTLTTKYYYRIAGNLLNACYPSSDKKVDSGPYSHSMSNIEENRLQNHYPTNIILDNNSIDENLPEFSLIGKLTVTDLDTADTHIYNLVSGVGDGDNTSFVISGDSLLCAISFDFESQNSYSIRIRCTDDGIDNLTYEKTFTIVVKDVIESGFADVYITSLKIYPNPFTNSTAIQFSNPENTKYLLYVRDLSGKLVRTLDDIYGDKVEFLRNDLPCGVYFVELKGDRVYRGKLVIE